MGPRRPSMTSANTAGRECEQALRAVTALALAHPVLSTDDLCSSAPLDLGSIIATVTGPQRPSTSSSNSTRRGHEQAPPATAQAARRPRSQAASNREDGRNGSRMPATKVGRRSSKLVEERPQKQQQQQQKQQKEQNSLQVQEPDQLQHVPTQPPPKPARHSTSLRPKWVSSTKPERSFRRVPPEEQDPDAAGSSDRPSPQAILPSELSGTATQGGLSISRSTSSRRSTTAPLGHTTQRQDADSAALTTSASGRITSGDSTRPRRGSSALLGSHRKSFPLGQSAETIHEVPGAAGMPPSNARPRSSCGVFGRSERQRHSISNGEEVDSMAPPLQRPRRGKLQDQASKQDAMTRTTSASASRAPASATPTPVPATASAATAAAAAAATRSTTATEPAFAQPATEHKKCQAEKPAPAVPPIQRPATATTPAYPRARVAGRQGYSSHGEGMLTRPRSSCGTGRRFTRCERPLTSRSRAETMQAFDVLDSGSSDDDEAAELRAFWQNLRCTGTATSSKLAAQVSRVSHPEPEVRLSSKTYDTSACTPHLQAILAGASPPGHLPTLRFAVPSSPRSPRSPTTAKKRLTSGNRLWKQLPQDMCFSIVCYLELDCICELICASTLLRSAGAVQAQAGWRLIVPHLQIYSRTCVTTLQHVWLPRTLWLEARSLNAKACGTLFACFERNDAARTGRALLELDLSSCKAACAQQVVALVRSCMGLRALNLGRTRLQDDGALELTNGLIYDPVTGRCNPHPQLRRLSLEENGLTEAACECLADAVVHMPLEELVLSRNMLCDAGVNRLVRGLLATDCSAQARLKRLDLSETRLSAEGLATVLSGLGSNGRFQSLDAGGNEGVGDDLAKGPTDTVQRLAATLAEASSLQDLQLWRCRLSDSACKFLVASRPPGIMSLNLAMNPLSVEVQTYLSTWGTGFGHFTIRL